MYYLEGCVMEAVDIISESELQAAVLSCAGTLGWVRHHEYQSRYAPSDRRGNQMTDKGFPDLCMSKVDLKGRTLIIYAELKTQKGRVSGEQWMWLKCLSGMRKGDAFSCIAGHLLDYHEVLVSKSKLYYHFGAVWRPEDWTSGWVEEMLADPFTILDQYELERQKHGY